MKQENCVGVVIHVISHCFSFRLLSVDGQAVLIDFRLWQLIEADQFYCLRFTRDNSEVLYLVIIFLHLIISSLWYVLEGCLILLLNYHTDNILFVVDASDMWVSSYHFEYSITSSLCSVDMSILKSLPSTIWMLDINFSCYGLVYRPEWLLFFSPHVICRYAELNGKMNFSQSWIHSGLHTEVTWGHFCFSEGHFDYSLVALSLCLQSVIFPPPVL